MLVMSVSSSRKKVGALLPNRGSLISGPRSTAGSRSSNSELTTGPRLIGSDHSENCPNCRSGQRLASLSLATDILAETAKLIREMARETMKLVFLPNIFVPPLRSNGTRQVHSQTLPRVAHSIGAASASLVVLRNARVEIVELRIHHRTDIDRLGPIREWAESSLMPARDHRGAHHGAHSTRH